MPSSAMNSRTPQCEVRSAAALWTSKSIGYSICRDAAEKPNLLSNDMSAGKFAKNL